MKDSSFESGQVELYLWFFPWRFWWIVLKLLFFILLSFLKLEHIGLLWANEESSVTAVYHKSTL
ncbi:hypothetical protein A3K34_02100 [candidate division WWE3 bacterium RIFOXYC1_FULL_40_10]|uniref:Uncharacterized protein n=1 Tax=candidate division WWE3 bacterium RIFOXYA2_FULL_46_9 TaxID=1802636 RepID=A0A1F4W057_UNCKA|nr:MAG: hypothetical protein A3K58_02100 [candidate division WWE3 bacterium RIFOXYB1_FULL_40_22]OGC61647.1 MAG: hypothetical protein A3K37_02100 [candidate division WWE3 bacterium RIFOXYA1_FULL_40_11]OGC62648.1 MAG: hypothetical protein A2264_02115 [candidate division WWE3 bacterium RIFOXYA2_FULL_46_9]OGC64404.1 MAG: hypothetical protein A2326_02555 [candidate division WWE3 bacterium RIFOXYB2_FULL_41_6]OGC66030.1 MAG: hypothetical protein A3K34_02100 [candidate division WWE3 bacterium RIFOXYC1_